MRIIKYAFVAIFLLFQFLGSAQIDLISQTYTTQRNEQSLNALIVLHKQLNAMNSSISGYRIQIYFESGNYSKTMAVKVKEEFESNFRQYNAYISFNEPYYRVRVGDFRTKIEAIGFLKKILRKYPNAFEVTDMISFNKLD